MIFPSKLTAAIVHLLFISSQGYTHSNSRSLKSLGTDKFFSSRYNDDLISQLGAPYNKPTNAAGNYITSANISVDYFTNSVDGPACVNDLVNKLDNFKGVLLTSSYEYPGRYSRWTVGFIAPAFQIEGKGLDFFISPLNERGRLLTNIIFRRLQQHLNLFVLDTLSEDGIITGSVIKSTSYFAEEERSKQPSLFSLIRIIRDIFLSTEAGQLGLYGALGYDLTFQFETIDKILQRGEDQRDIVMYFPDEITVVDNQKKDAWTISYEFTEGSISTKGLPRESCKSAYVPAPLDDQFSRRDR